MGQIHEIGQRLKATDLVFIEANILQVNKILHALDGNNLIAGKIQKFDFG